MKDFSWPLMENAITKSDRIKLASFIITTDKFTNGPEVRKFEQQWAEWVGSKYALMVSSGSTANFLIIASAIKHYGLNPGDKVLVPACTWVTNVAPVIQLGLQPIFCDINLENFSFDIQHMIAIKQQHPDIKAIFVTHLLGYSADNEAYQNIFPDALIFDDICESHGCKGLNGKRRGADSLAASFSFYFGHHITTIEGGMVNCNDENLYELMRMQRSHGLARESNNKLQYQIKYPDIDPQFLFVADGYNFRSTDFNAVLGQNQLPRLDGFINIRQHNFQKFVILSQDYSYILHPTQWQQGNSNYAFPLICHNPVIASQLRAALTNRNIEHRPIVSGNLLRQPFLSNYTMGAPKDSYNVDKLHDCGVYVGNSQFVTNKHLEVLQEVLEEVQSYNV